ncbi:glycerophosphodiester phosphodiesterase family protein [Paradevosia shaoguanensis]|uniref:Glycerophosphodiester phosphodiesterase n=1 Tax=Paradevosia shaoguanensis TaxID=1335043 RepID=A0AA41QNG0_9HYPH|nr:glycerophosphodiester phosphodiesterase family protein [Paradevosia shaoguanensis]MCF1742900.1 glycerophosphodiester phosphodiesterase [Paradevosia shaoguanensis]MCI0127383.1 glycerophosphodiester phosphodiesterase [Paradevosia shaoguanensis]
MSKLVFDRPIAHRGLHDRQAGVIENSRSAFDAAIAGRFAIECDLQLTSDGVPVVFHDDDRLRLQGVEGFVRNATAEEMTSTPLLGAASGDCPQTFDDFLAQVNGRTLLQVELKTQTHENTQRLADAAAKAVKDYKGPLVFESFDPHLIAAVRRAGFDGKVGIITYSYDDPDEDGRLTDSQRFQLRHLIHAPWSRFDFISCYQKSLDLPAVRFFRAMGVPVTAWTIRSANEAREVAGRADQLVFEGFDPDRV